MKSKAQKQAWWNNLSADEQGEYIAKKQAEKAQKRARTNYASTCPVYPTITDENRAQWQARIRAKNPWVKFSAEAPTAEGCLI